MAGSGTGTDAEGSRSLVTFLPSPKRNVQPPEQPQRRFQIDDSIFMKAQEAILTTYMATMRRVGGAVPRKRLFESKATASAMEDKAIKNKLVEVLSDGFGAILKFDGEMQLAILQVAAGFAAAQGQWDLQNPRAPKRLKELLVEASEHLTQEQGVAVVKLVAALAVLSKTVDASDTAQDELDLNVRAAIALLSRLDGPIVGNLPPEALRRLIIRERDGLEELDRAMREEIRASREWHIAPADRIPE